MEILRKRELSPEDTLVQRAATEYWNAKYSVMTPAERAYHRSAFLAVSRLLTPVDRELDERGKVIACRGYASEQFQQATGQPFGLSTQNWRVWQNELRAAAASFQPERGFAPEGDLDLAQAILGDIPGIDFNPENILVRS